MCAAWARLQASCCALRGGCCVSAQALRRWHAPGRQAGLLDAFDNKWRLVGTRCTPPAADALAAASRGAACRSALAAGAWSWAIRP